MSSHQEALDRLELARERCQTCTRGARDRIVETREIRAASRMVCARTFLTVHSEKARNLRATAWRSPLHGAYVTQWRAPESGDMDDVKVITAFHLRRLRADAGLSQPQLASRLEGVDRRNVSRWERAEVSPSWTHICALAGIFGCNPGEFYRVPEELEEVA